MGTAGVLGLSWHSRLAFATSQFGAAWDVATAGDVNQDGRAELILARNIDKDMIVLTGQQNSGGAGSVWSQLWDSRQYQSCSDCTWNSMTVGRVFNDPNIPGNQLVVNLHSSDPSRNSTVIFNWDGNNMVDITPVVTDCCYFDPSFTDLALAKLDSTAAPYSQIIELRQVSSSFTDWPFMKMLNFAGVSLPSFEVEGDYDTNSWYQVAAGDLLGTGHNQVVTLRHNTLRVYDRPWVDNHYFLDAIGSFYASPATNVTTLAVAQMGFSNVGPVAPGVSVQPAGVSVLDGQQATFQAAATGLPAPAVQWQVRSGPGGTWADIPGATATRLSFIAHRTDTGKQYRAVFTNAGGTAATNPATLTVADVAIAGLAVINSSPTFLPAATTFTASVTAGTNVTYQWDFGDGSPVVWLNSPATHTYLWPGIYTATVTAMNTAGSSVKTTEVVIRWRLHLPLLAQAPASRHILTLGGPRCTCALRVRDLPRWSGSGGAWPRTGV